jgi:phage head maturation protease
MPLNRCQDDGKPGWKWGDAGTCYTYASGDESSEAAARKKAMAQAAAMGEFPGTGQQRGTDPATSEVEHRSSTLQDVNKKQRLVDLIAVPYDQEADVFWRGEIWHESHDRHAYDGLEAHAGRVQANREHVKGNTVGRLVAADPSHQDGLLARVKIYSTPLGDETLTLADEGGAFPSVGFRVNGFADQRIDKRSRTRRILRAFLDHLAFVEDPAYVGAEVLAVRAGQSGLAVAEKPLPDTPLLDEALNDPTLAWAAQHLNR